MRSEHRAQRPAVPLGRAELPRLVVVTDRAQAAPRPLVDVIRRAAEGGATAVLLREKDLPVGARAELAAALRPMVEVLLAASTPLGAADGVHLSSSDPIPCTRPRLLGRSCHGAGELHRAALEGCDYVTVSPVFASPSKPGYGPALGTEVLRRLVAEAAHRPAGGGGPRVFALGGVTAASAAACVGAGAHGVAVMGEVMRADDPAQVVAEILAALATTADPAAAAGRSAR